MTAFESHGKKDGFSMKLWRGERMCLIGFDVEDPEPDLVGFSIECREPGEPDFFPLMNRIAFSYDAPADLAVTGARKFPSTESPFQKFRWVHFPYDPKPGTYTYRGTKIHMPADGKKKRGAHVQLDISLDPVTYAGFLDVGFTRGFASSQAFLDRFPTSTDIDEVGKKIIPAKADEGLGFQKLSGDIYDWLGFEAYDLIFGFLNQAVADPSIHVDAFAYDFNEPDILERLEKLGPRLRAILDDSSTHSGTGSAESKAAKRLRASAGKANIKRTHFGHLQHHKVLIASRGGKPFKVLAGSTNFSFRGVYIQSNNVLVFDQPDVAELYGRVFQASFDDPSAFKNDELASKWHLVHAQGRPPIQFCFSPHTSPDLSLNPLRGAIDQAVSSVLYSIAFLYQIQSGPTREAIDRLMTRPVFSYGVSDKKGNLEVRKPDGSIGLVDFAYLAKHSPQPFRREWSGGKGINVHHKFVVTDFSLPTAKVFTGSSNLSPAGERGNGDHLIMIEDRRIATGYAIEALRVFDHLHFRSRMRDVQKAKKAGKKPQPLALRKPRAITGKPAWFEAYYVAGSQRERDRKLFSG
jgi:hypothetical protein